MASPQHLTLSTHPPADSTLRKEVAQLYVHDRIASRVRPVRELKGFKKASGSGTEAFSEVSASYCWICGEIPISRTRVVSGSASGEGSIHKTGLGVAYFNPSSRPHGNASPTSLAVGLVAYTTRQGEGLTPLVIGYAAYTQRLNSCSFHEHPSPS